uniref:Uncharacterized protein n=1 Tax=Cyclopterus lumpus TaxID=8103 RepID=A0A8C3A0I9_CYCLU
VLMHGNSVMLNCSRPDTPSLLEALQPVFNLSSIRPVMNLSTPTNVSIDFTIYSILGVVRDNSLPMFYMEKNSAPFVPYSYLFSDGLVIDYQPVKVISSCKLDIYKFPFDIQNCSLSFNSYLHQTALQIDLSSTVADILKYSKEVMTTMGEWELVGLTVNTYLPPAGNEDVYEEMRFFVIKRRATLYVVNLLIPSCFLVMVDLFSFLLPPQNVDRSLFKMTLILGYTVFLLIMNDLLPASGNTVPLISVFLCLCLALMVASLLETILITNLLYGSAHYPPVPCWFRVFVLHILGLIRNPAAQGPLDKEKAWKELRHLESDLQAIRLQVKHRLGEGQGSEEWIQVGSIIDRLLLSLYIIFISVSFITITTIWMQSYNTS